MLLADAIVGGASQFVRPMSCKAIGFADQRSRRRFMSLDGARANARHHCRRSTTCDRMRPHQRRYGERVSSLRSMPDRGKDAAVARSQMRTSTTISSVPVSMRTPWGVGIAIQTSRLRSSAEGRRFHDFPLSLRPTGRSLSCGGCGLRRDLAVSRLFPPVLIRPVIVRRSTVLDAHKYVRV